MTTRLSRRPNYYFNELKDLPSNLLDSSDSTLQQTQDNLPKMSNTQQDLGILLNQDSQSDGENNMPLISQPAKPPKRMKI